MNRARDRGACVLLFFLSFFLLLSSGRIASVDAGQQLQASTMLALTGHLGDDGTSGGPSTEAWVRAPNGRFYQPHDIGNIILMLPAAAAGAWLSAAPPAEDIRNPPVQSRVAVSLTCAGVAALGCYWLFRLFALYWDARTAFLLALAFPMTTIFIAYARAAWDVLPAASLMCAVLVCSAAIFRRDRPGRDAVMLAIALAGLCSFRFSLVPFIVPAAAAVVVTARHRVPGPAVIASAVTFAALMIPSFVYNVVRTGSVLRPATASAQYLAGNNALTGNILHGLYGLLLSPNRGLFVFSPVLLIGLALPFVWRRLAADQRTLVACYGAGCCAYVLLIASMVNWGAFGWGPRYLVPILPVLFAAAALSIVNADRHLKAGARVLVCVSTILSIPPAIVNWHLATTAFLDGANPYATTPAQQIAGWKTLALGLQGKSLTVPEDSSADPLRATTGDFPDLLLARIARTSRAGFVFASLVTLGLITTVQWSARVVFVPEPSRTD